MAQLDRPHYWRLALALDDYLDTSEQVLSLERHQRMEQLRQWLRSVD